MLENISSLPSKQNQQEIIEYYYMQHIFFMLGRDPDFLGFGKYKGEAFSDAFLEDYTKKMDSNYFEILDSAIADGFKLIEQTI